MDCIVYQANVESLPIKQATKEQEVEAITITANPATSNVAFNAANTKLKRLLNEKAHTRSCNIHHAIKALISPPSFSSPTKLKEKPN
jgi:hypothetical protein